MNPPFPSLRDKLVWWIEKGVPAEHDLIVPWQDTPFISAGAPVDCSVLEAFDYSASIYLQNECRRRDLTYQSPLRVRAKLLIKQTGEIKEMTVFMGDFPLMSTSGTFIYNGTERVVVSQLVRSPGVYYTRKEDPSGSRFLYSAKLIPNRGAWLEFETSAKDILTVKVDKRRTIPVTALLRAVGYGTDSEVYDLFHEVDTNPDHPYIATTIGGQDGAQRRDPSNSHESGLREVYKRIRPGDPVTLDNAKNLIDSTFFNSRRYDLGRVGRYKLNKRLAMPTPPGSAHAHAGRPRLHRAPAHRTE